MRCVGYLVQWRVGALSKQFFTRKADALWFRRKLADGGFHSVSITPLFAGKDLK